MKVNSITKEVQEEALQVLNQEGDKSEAIIKAVEILNSAKHESLIKQLQEESADLEAQKQNTKQLGLRTLSSAEKDFYSKVKQSVTVTQNDVIPTTIIDSTLADVKKASTTLKLVNMAPAGVMKWISASASGTAMWGAIDEKLTSELSTTIESMSIDANKLYVVMIIPKAIRDLSMPFVDKYFRAVLAEAMHDGLVKGFLDGDGKVAPIGIMRQVKKANQDSTKAAKTLNTTLTGFAPLDLAPVKKILSNDGKRAVDKIYLIANPSDVYAYVEPALHLLTANGYLSVSKTEIEVIAEPMCAAGKAVLTLDKVYTMGMTAPTVHEYKETKALDDCDTFVAKAYANGRAVDDNTAYVFNPTKLVPAILSVKTISDTTETPETSETPTP